MSAAAKQPWENKTNNKPVPSNKVNKGVDTRKEPDQRAEGKSKTVSVGCKLPNGLHLDLGQPGDPQNRISLRGSNSATVIGGFGITHGVDEQFFAEWMKRNKSLDMVKNGLIFEHTNPESVRQYANENAEVQTGLEPLNPAKLKGDIQTLVQD